MNILIVADSYYPKMSMNGIIAKNLADEIKKKNKVDVLSYATEYNNSRDFIYGDVQVYYVLIKNNILNAKLHRKMETSSGLKKELQLLKLTGIRLISYLNRYKKGVGIDERISKKIAEKINLIINQDCIEEVILVGAPFEIIQAGYMSKRINPKVKFVGYLVDLFATARPPYLKGWMLERMHKARRKLLLKYLDVFDDFFFYNIIKKSEESYLTYNLKVKSVGIPLITKNEFLVSAEKEKNTKKDIVFVYTGTLHTVERPPEKAIELLVETTTTRPKKIHIYHIGNCQTVIRDACERYEGTVINHGSVNTELCYKAQAESDFLIHISTIYGKQIAGKTFNYIATGKPIIFFYFVDNDLNKLVYEKYGLACCIQLKDNIKKENIKSLQYFIETNIGKRYSFKKISECFWEYTPECIAREMGLI